MQGIALGTMMSQAKRKQAATRAAMGCGALAGGAENLLELGEAGAPPCQRPEALFARPRPWSPCSLA